MGTGGGRGARREHRAREKTNGEPRELGKVGELGGQDTEREQIARKMMAPLDAVFLIFVYIYRSRKVYSLLELP